jgi:ferritin-like metal-binding protein YciE
MHTPAPDEVMKNTFANLAFEHCEIAAYKSLLTLADAGQESAVSMLERSLAEEEAMAQWIADHIGETTTTFVHRTEAGETAAV